MRSRSSAWFAIFLITVSVLVAGCSSTPTFDKLSGDLQGRVSIWCIRANEYRSEQGWDRYPLDWCQEDIATDILNGIFPPGL